MDKANRQMEFLFEEGGMADDGLDRDPVSGNEVPSGSMSEEVRDDIPAQLSEGEYVVPADVVRYYGVKYFEDLREDAKEGLTSMEEEGRIGGEPVDMEGDDTDLSPEEMAELDAIMGMAVGGYVTEQPTQATEPYKAQTELYRSPAPVAIGNTMEPRGFQAGGTVPAATQVMPDFSQYAAGYSFMGPQAGQTGIPSIQPSSNVTLYGPNGEVVNLILPAQQAQYDDLISQGYSTQPVAQVQTPTVQTQEDSGDNDQQQAPEREGMSRFGSLGKVDFSDPIGDAEAALTGEGRGGSIGGALVGALVGMPVLGVGIGKAIGQSNSIAEATANAEIAKILGYDTSELDTSIDSTIDGMNFASRTAARRARDAAREETKSRFYDALKDPTSNIQFSLDRSSFQTDEAYNQSLADLARSVEQSSGLESGSVVAMGQGTDDEGSQFAQDYQRAQRHAAQNPQGMTTGQPLSSRNVESLLPPTPGQEPRSASDQAGDGGDSSKIICTAMNASYGFGSYRQAIWLQYSEKHLTPWHEKGYHKIFLPLVDRAYNRGDKNSKIIRAILEHGTRHRTADLRAEMQGKKRDTLGRIYRSIFEPICYIAGRLSK